MKTGTMLILGGIVLSAVPVSGAEIFCAFAGLENGAEGLLSQKGIGKWWEVDQPGPVATGDFAIYHYRVAVGAYYYNGTIYNMPPSEVPSATLTVKVGDYNTNGVFVGSTLLTEAITLSADDDFVPTGKVSWSGVSISELNVYFTPVMIFEGERPWVSLVFNVDEGLTMPQKKVAVYWTSSTVPGGQEAQAVSYYPTPWSLQYPEWVAADLMTVPDVDNDNDTIVDMGDLSVVIACLKGPGVTTPPPGLEVEFALADLDNDGDVDLRDFRGWQLAFMGEASL